MEVSENSLAEAAASGDSDAFAALLERCYDRMFALSFKLLGSRADAEDLTQDLCAALPDKIVHFHGGSQFSTWLYRVVVNAAHDRRRRQASHMRAADGWGDWEIARRAEAAEATDQADWLMLSLSKLPDDLRDTLILILDDITHADAGDILGVSEGTISWRVSKTKELLRAMAQAEVTE